MTTDVRRARTWIHVYIAGLRVFLEVTGARSRRKPYYPGFDRSGALLPRRGP